MKIKWVKEFLNAAVLSGEELLEEEVCSACGCDLMSDALAFVKDQSVLITGLTNPQVMRTAEMLDMKCVVFVRGKKPDDKILDMADRAGIVVMSTRYPLYTACGILYQHGLAGGRIH